MHLLAPTKITTDKMMQVISHNFGFGTYNPKNSFSIAMDLMDFRMFFFFFVCFCFFLYLGLFASNGKQNKKTKNDSACQFYYNNATYVLVLGFTSQLGTLYKWITDSLQPIHTFHQPWQSFDIYAFIPPNSQGM